MNDTQIQSAEANNDELLLWIHKNMPDFTSPNTRHLPHLSRLASFGGQTLANLIESSAGLAPNLFRTRQKHYLGSKRSGYSPKRPGETDPERPDHERRMCFDLWKQQLRFHLGKYGRSAVLHSYEVPLLSKKHTKASDGKEIAQRKIDLLASSSNGNPIVIEAKHSGDSTHTISRLFAQFIQGLCYSVTLRYTWTQSSTFSQEWSKLPNRDSHAYELPDELEEVPLILAADTGYWNKTFDWGDEQMHWEDLNTLVAVAQNAGYPIFLGVIREPVSPDTQWQFQVVAWDSLPIPTTNGPIQFPEEPTS